MKLNSHLIGWGLGAAALCAWLFFVEKEVEKYNGHYIWKIGGQFVAERLSDERKTNPRFDTIEMVRAWIDARVLGSKLKAKLPGNLANTVANAMPWG